MIASNPPSQECEKQDGQRLYDGPDHQCPEHANPQDADTAQGDASERARQTDGASDEDEGRNADPEREIVGIGHRSTQVVAQVIERDHAQHERRETDAMGAEEDYYRSDHGVTDSAARVDGRTPALGLHYLVGHSGLACQ
jgi:hypothetical protein